MGRSRLAQVTLSGLPAKSLDATCTNCVPDPTPSWPGLVRLLLTILNSRLADQTAHRMARQPLRVVVDSSGRLPLESTLLRQPGETLVATTGGPKEKITSLEEAGAEVLTVPALDGRVDLFSLLKELGLRGVTTVFVEGGGTLLGSLFDAGLVDRVVAFVAPVIIGGDSALSPVGGVGVGQMSDALRLSDVQIETFGDDVAVTGWCSPI